MIRIATGQNMNQDSDWGDKLLHRFTPEKREAPFTLSIIIPVFNAASGIGVSLKSIERQNYPATEVILVDAGSTDRTLEIASEHSSLITRLYTVAQFRPYEMINRGLSLTTGKYVTFLFAGSYYLSDNVFYNVTHEIMKKEEPDLLYTGCFQREGRRSQRYIGFPFSLYLLERGMMPAAIPACFWRSELFEKIGKFQTHLPLRSGFEFFCRLHKEKKAKVSFFDRVYVDYDYGPFSYAKLVAHTKDTWRILDTHFGFFKALKWFFGISHFNLVRLFARHVKRRLIKV